MRIDPLAEALLPLLESPSTLPTLFAGPWRLGHALAEHASLLTLERRPRRAPKQAHPTVIASSLAAPFACHSLANVVLVRQVKTSTPEALLRAVAPLLARGGRVFLVETTGGPFAARGSRPERLSAALLNAGFTTIEQRWPAPRVVIAVGSAGAATHGQGVIVD